MRNSTRIAKRYPPVLQTLIVSSPGLAKSERIARFIEPMECLPVEQIPEGGQWTYELKLDGYRIEAVKTGGEVTLYRVSQVSNQTVSEMLVFVKSHGLEGIIAKRADSVYEPGRRSGMWVKRRINLSQEFVIGGYVPGHPGVDPIVIGFYRDKQLHYAARVRAGFVPLTRLQVFERIKPLETVKCPFVNLPEKEVGRWGQGLTAEKMKECVWVSRALWPTSSSWSGPVPIIFDIRNSSP